MSSPATPRWEPTPEQQVILNLPGTVEMATPNVRAPALPGTTHHWAPLGTIGHHWAPLGTIGHQGLTTNCELVGVGLRHHSDSYKYHTNETRVRS